MMWDDCEGAKHIAPISGTAWRLVESQEQIATLEYVDTLEEQALLEELLDSAKPAYPANTAGYHYLLKTPFRYPPLRWGSRFGRVHEPGIFYAGTNIQTTLAESAYYRWVFWYSINAQPIKNKIRSEHTLFAVDYQSALGIQLHGAPFKQFLTSLTHPQDYSATQQLGTAMRAAAVAVFEYVSARDAQRGLCVGLFTPAAFSQKTPKETSAWLCEVSAHEVAFKQRDKTEVIRFSLEQFMVKGELPLPAG